MLKQLARRIGTLPSRPPFPASPQPQSPSFFTGRPVYYDLLSHLDNLFESFRHIPGTHTDSPPVYNGTLSRSHLSTIIDHNLTVSEYRRIVEKINALLKLPAFRTSEELQSELRKYEKTTIRKKDLTEMEKIDEFGRSYGYGWRKSASARVWIIPALPETVGKALINGQDLSTYFINQEQAEQCLRPLLVTNTVGKYNVWALVRGGGTTGQSEATRLALARALLLQEPELRDILRPMGLISHDWRTVERKKPGQAKARKKYTWVKR